MSSIRNLKDVDGHVLSSDVDKASVCNGLFSNISVNEITSTIPDLPGDNSDAPEFEL